MKSIYIYRSYVVIPPAFDTKLPSEGHTSLSEIAKVVVGIRKFSHFMHSHLGIRSRCWSNYDGYPFEDHCNVYFGNVSDTEYYRDAPLSVEFNDTRSDEFDYIAKAARDTTTAYKRGRKMEPKDTKFLAYAARISCNSENASVWIGREIDRLNPVIRKLEEATTSLAAWVTSGHDMRIYCSRVMCRWGSDVPIIDSSRLAAFADRGLTLEELKTKLRCTKCGSNCSHLAPA